MNRRIVNGFLVNNPASYWHRLSALPVVLLLFVSAAAQAQAQDKPNILVLWGDDIGTWNISHNNRGMMGYRTPNIDRIAPKGWLLPTTTRSKVAPRVELRLSVDRCPCAAV